MEIDPFTRPPKISLAALLRNAPCRRSMLLLGRLIFTGSVKAWSKYLDMAHPGRKPADWDTWLARLQANLGEPGRVMAAQKMGSSKPVDAAAHLANVRCAALVIMGRNDSDFPDAEAAANVSLPPAGLGRYQRIETRATTPTRSTRRK